MHTRMHRKSRSFLNRHVDVCWERSATSSTSKCARSWNASTFDDIIPLQPAVPCVSRFVLRPPSGAGLYICQKIYCHCFQQGTTWPRTREHHPDILIPCLLPPSKYELILLCYYVIKAVFLKKTTAPRGVSPLVFFCNPGIWFLSHYDGSPACFLWTFFYPPAPPHRLYQPVYAIRTIHSSITEHFTY